MQIQHKINNHLKKKKSGVKFVIATQDSEGAEGERGRDGREIRNVESGMLSQL